ncbi:hypothetical protein [Hydrogenimonas urashimensis]|uniref:hypothetical protein n=1 Tax=Hydrogenimonas urashimensis TaxID=2740515 RepID=UPI0019168EC0|nr:hypothetical protein [Hydrogenimonas urashimensis]
MSRWIILAIVAIAVIVLWRLSLKTPAAISFTQRGMLLQNGECRLHLPMEKIESENFQADALLVERTVATFPNGYRVVDEKVSMPENYTFGKAVSAMVRAVFGMKHLESVAENRKMVVYEGVLQDGRTMKVLAVFKGKKDLELLYPLNESFFLTIKRCLIDGKAAKEPTIVNHVIDESEDSLIPYAKWDQKLFDLDILINKDM